jgi:hypothetical protein
VCRHRRGGRASAGTGAGAGEGQVESDGGRLIQVVTTERVVPAMSERTRWAVAHELRVLGGKRKDTNERASIYRLKRISNGS